jgi:hypothetical protein
MVLEVTRREFLLVNAAAGVAAALSPALFSAVLGPALSDEQRETLLLITKTLLPHERADDKLYVNAVNAIEMRCRKDSKISRIVTSGIGEVSAACGSRAGTPARGKCTQVLKAMESSDFFRLVYAETLENVYGSPDTWNIFAGRLPVRGETTK